MEQFFSFNIFKSSLDFASDIYNSKISLEKAGNSQYKMFELLNNLKDYNPTKLDKIKSKEETLNDAEKLYKNRSNVINISVYRFPKEKPDTSEKALPA